MEKKNNYWLVGFCIAIAALLGFVFGFRVKHLNVIDIGKIKYGL